MTATIRNPGSWSVDQIGAMGRHVGAYTASVGSDETAELPQVRRLGFEDLRLALRRGMEDFAACRSDVAFLCLLYPVIGIVMAWVAFHNALLPLVFPMMAGFALVGPVAAVGLYEMSRRRERGEPASFADAFRVAASPSFGAIFALGLMLFATFIAWMIVADQIHQLTLGPDAPASFGIFLTQVFTTAAGWTMILVGLGVGFLFAVAVLATSVISFPMLRDRKVGLPVAVVTSIRVTRENPGVIGAWGAIVAGALLAGSIPAFLGLIVVMPVLGHATWHLYRRAVIWPDRT